MSVAIAAHYRARLQQLDANAAYSLRSAHQQALQQITPHLAVLYKQLAQAQEQAQQADEPLTMPWLLAPHRLPAIEQATTRAIDHFSTTAHALTIQAQQHASALGQQSAHASIQAATGQPAAAPHTANVAQGGTKGAALAALFTGFGIEAARGVKSALLLGVSLAQSVASIAGQVTQALSTSLSRALTIVSDQAIRAYRGAVSALKQANSATLTGWRWLADLASACAACLAEHGSIHPLDEEMESHLRCHCEQEFITAESPDIQSGADWFDEQDASTQEEILGKGAYALYRSGRIDLADMVTHVHNPIWGDSIAQTPLKELVKR